MNESRHTNDSLDMDDTNNSAAHVCPFVDGYCSTLVDGYCSTVVDGYCSTLQGLLDWFEVDLITQRHRFK